MSAMSDRHVHSILNAIKKEHLTVCNNVLNIFSVELNKRIYMTKTISKSITNIICADNLYNCAQ